MTQSSSLLQKLLKAHVAHEIEYFTGTHFKSRFLRELAPLNDWLMSRRLDQLLSEEEAQKIAADIWSSPVGIETIQQLILTLLSDSNSLEKLDLLSFSDLFPPDFFEKFKELPLDNGKIRQQILRLFVDQEVYARLVYDLLFNGIRDFVLEENPITKNIPAAGRIFKMGRDLMEKRLPRISEEAEKKIKSFIKPYLHRPIEHTREFLEEPKNQKLFQDLQDEIIGWVKSQKLPSASLPEKQKEFILQMSQDVLKHWQQNPLAKELLQQTVSHFYRQHGTKTLSEILMQYQIPQAIILKKVVSMAHSLFKKAQKEGHLEEAIHAHLKDFYESDIANKLLRTKD